MFLRPWRNATRLPGCGLVGCQVLTSVADALIGSAFVILTVAQLVLWSSSNSAEKPWDNRISVVLVAIWFSAALHLLFATVLEAVLPIAPRGPTENGDSGSPLQSKVLARVHVLFYGDAHVAAACAICLFVPLRDASVAEAFSGRSSVVDELAHWAHLLAWCSWLFGLPLSAHQFSLVAWPLVVFGVVAGAPGSPCRVNFGASEASNDQSSNSWSNSNGNSSTDDGLLGGLLVGCDLQYSNMSGRGLWTVLATATLCLLCLSSCCFAAGCSSRKKAPLPILKPPSLGDDQAHFNNSSNQSRTCSISQATSGAMYALDVFSPLSALLLVALYPLPALLAFAFSATVLALASFCASGSSASSLDSGQVGQSSGLRARATGDGVGASRALVATAESTDSWAPTDVAASTSRDVTLVWPRLPDVEGGSVQTRCSGCFVSSSSLSCWNAGSSCCSSEVVSGVGQKFLWPLAYGPGTYRRSKCIARWENDTTLLVLTGNDDSDYELTTAQQREELVGALSDRLRQPPPASPVQGRNANIGGGGGGGGRNRPRSPHTSFARSSSGSGGAGKRGSAANRNGSSYKPSATTSAVAKPLPAFFSSGAVRVPVPSKLKTPRHKTTTTTNASTNGGASTPHRAPPSRLPSIGSFLHSPSAARTGSGNHFFQFKPSEAHWQGMLNEPAEGRGGSDEAHENDGLRSPRNSFVLGADEGGASNRNSNHHRYAAFTTKSPEPEIGRRYEEEDIEDKDEYYDDLKNSHYELTEAAQARGTATEATLWKHKISYHGHHLQQPPNDQGRASRATATTATDRKTRASRESVDSQGDDNGGGGEDPSQLINDLTSRPVRESTESIGANTAAMKSKGSNSNHRRRKSGGSRQQQPSLLKGGNSRFKSAAPTTANEPGRVPTPLPPARTVTRARAFGQPRAETYVVGGLRSPANATNAQGGGGGASGGGGVRGRNDSRGGYEPTVWPESSSGKTMRAGGGERSGTPLPLSNKHPASNMRGPSRSRAPNLVTIPAGTSMDARI